ncbi:MAG: hypothetical protein HYX68_28250 [Planctomycetes bacterium]|jgi:YHS domain-containing protein|nr:hypothetical protein [Planctomycetota bacterium]
MNDLNDLLARIETEASLQQERQHRLQQERLLAFERRKCRFQDLYLPAMNRLKAIWFPRLELLKDKFQALAQRFGETVTSEAVSSPSPEEQHTGAMQLACDSPLARIRLTFSFFHDVDIRNLVVDYKLDIIPVFLRFDGESRLELALETFDDETLVEWLDNLIVNFFRTYLAMHENSTYLADQIVEDPIAKVRFPKYAAETVSQKNGNTFYFISPETKREFERRSANALQATT